MGVPVVMVFSFVPVLDCRAHARSVEAISRAAVVDAALIDGPPHLPLARLPSSCRSSRRDSDAGRRSREPERAHSLRPLDVFVGLRMKFEVHESKPNLELIRYDFLENSAEQPTRSVR